MKIVVSGSRGLIGSALCSFLREKGHAVVQLLRGDGAGIAADGVDTEESGNVYWNPERGILDPAVLRGAQAVIHLGGENLFTLWTEANKRRFRKSRVDSTRLISQALATMEEPPAVFLCASAVGYYGHRYDEVLDEDSDRGEGFLAELGRDWEAATAAASEKGIRTVSMRTGVVLAPDGGILGMLAPIFRLGLGGPLGSGGMFMSWIAIEDVLRAIEFLLANDLRGPVNLVAPEPVTNFLFTRALGELLERPTTFAVPEFLLRLAPGGMGEELLLASARVLPRRLEEAGFEFRYSSLKEALRQQLVG